MIITGIVFPPLWIINYFYYRKWLYSPSAETVKKLSSSLQLSIVFGFIEILVICFLFYQYGRNFIHIMGTFY